MSEQIGKHKGAVETLMHEKKELSRLLQIVNSQLQRHLTALEEQGIDAEEYIEQIQEGGQGQSGQRQSSSNSGQRSGQNSQRSGSRSRSSSSRSRSSGSGRSRGDSSDQSGDSGDRDFNPL